jgi:hypothetical protein
MTRLGFCDVGDSGSSNSGAGRREDGRGDGGGGDGDGPDGLNASKRKQLTHIDIAATLNELTEAGEHAGTRSAGHSGAASPGSTGGVERGELEGAVATPEGLVTSYPADLIGWGLDT